MKFHITQHCQTRYSERCLNGLNTVNILKAVLTDIYSAKNITSEISNKNPRFILFLYEKYKKSGTLVFKKDKLYFIGIKRKGVEIIDILTCYYGDDKFKMFENTTMSRDEIFFKIKSIKYKLKH